MCSRSRSKVTWYAHFLGFLEWATPSLTVWFTGCWPVCASGPFRMTSVAFCAVSIEAVACERPLCVYGRLLTPFKVSLIPYHNVQFNVYSQKHSDSLSDASFMCFVREMLCIIILHCSLLLSPQEVTEFRCPYSSRTKSIKALRKKGDAVFWATETMTVMTCEGVVSYIFIPPPQTEWPEAGLAR